MSGLISPDAQKFEIQWNCECPALFYGSTQAVRKMAQRNGRKQTLPVAEERLRVGKRKVETGRVRVSTRTEERQQPIREKLLREEVEVERVRIDRFSDTEPQIHQDGDVLIVPVFEEVLVKRILVREELRITRKRRVDEVQEQVTLKRQNVVVERTSRR